MDCFSKGNVAYVNDGVLISELEELGLAGPRCHGFTAHSLQSPISLLAAFVASRVVLFCPSLNCYGRFAEYNIMLDVVIFQCLL
jgi:hypothetical protein